MKAESTAMTQRPRDRVPSGSMLALPDPRRSDLANPATNFWWSLFLTALAWSTCTGFPLDAVNKEYYVEALREFRKRFRRKRPALFKSGLWHFHQNNAPVHNSILVTDNLTVMDIKTLPRPPYSPDLAPCNFWLFPKLRSCRYETLEEMKEAVTKVIDTSTQEDYHGIFQNLLERYKCIAVGGDYFEGDLSFMCVLSIKVPTRKISGNLFNDPPTLLKNWFYIISSWWRIDLVDWFFCFMGYQPFVRLFNANFCWFSCLVFERKWNDESLNSFI